MTRRSATTLAPKPKKLYDSSSNASDPFVEDNRLVSLTRYTSLSETNKARAVKTPRVSRPKSKLVYPESRDYVHEAIDNKSTLPYHYPPIKQVHRMEALESFDIPLSLQNARNTSNDSGSSKRLKRIVKYSQHDVEKQIFDFSNIPDSFCARAYKKYLGEKGFRAISILDEVKFNEYSASSKLDIMDAPQFTKDRIEYAEKNSKNNDLSDYTIN